jgi:hypothetical protein
MENYDYESSKRNILIHAGHVIDDDVSSLIGCLRPYTGVSEADFKTFIMSLICVKSSLESENVNRELVYACWDFCYRIRVLASSIFDNGIIPKEEYDKLIKWGECVESFCRRSFQKTELDACLSSFLEYLASDSCKSPYDYQELSSLFESMKPEADFEMKPLIEEALVAISRE